MRLLAALLSLMGVWLMASGSAEARTAAAYMEKFEILEDRPAFEGAAFGEVGPYRFISAKAYIVVRRTHAANRLIVDLDHAPRTAEGDVRYAAEVMILRPADPRRASKSLLVEVPNRGMRIGLMGLQDVNPMLAFMPQPGGGGPKPAFSTKAEAGSGFLLRRGYALVWIGWQADLGPGPFIRAELPIATDNGKPITGRVHQAMVYDTTEPAHVLPLSYAVADGQEAATQLSYRPRWSAPATPIPGWSFVDARHVRFEKPAAADAGAIYEVAYTAKDPIVAGLGLTAFRDVLSFLRGDAAANPIRDIAPAHVLGMGSSQSGRFLRDFLYHGYNEDGAGVQVFDGLLVNIAGSRRTFTNRRWAEPGRFSRQHEDWLVYGNQFPFAYGVTKDPLTGARGGIMERCEASGTCPKIFHVDGSAEFWSANGSLVANDGAGKDLAFPPNVRGFMIAGAPHAPTMVNASSLLPASTLTTSPVLRALMLDLDAWVSQGVAPPDSRWPSQAKGELAPAASRADVRFPELKAIPYSGAANSVAVTDYAQVPPLPDPKRQWTTLVPVTDSDGNDAAGVRLPEIAAPKGTYLGWNPRKSGYAEGELSFVFGGYVPFAETKEARLAAGDPRPSLAERYAGDAERQAKYEAAKAALKRDRLYLDGAD
jgi:hypothetical protein